MFSSGSCIVGVLSVDRSSKIFIFFKKGRYTVEEVQEHNPGFNFMEESLAMNSLNDNRNLSNSKVVTKKRLTQLPGIDPNYCEVNAVEVTPDEKWLILSAYEHHEKTGKLMVFRRKGVDLEYCSKLSLMWESSRRIQGKFFN